MSNRNIYFVLFLLLALTAVGFFFGWRLVCGVLLGVALMVWIFNRRFSVYDEIETEVFWLTNYSERKKERGYEDQTFLQSAWEVKEFLLLVVLFLLVVFVVVVGLLG